MARLNSVALSDWDLEYQTGNIEAQVGLSVTAQQSWNGVLPSVPIGSETPVNTTLTNNQVTNIESPRSIASDSNGNFVVVWNEDGARDGFQRGVYTQRFAANGNKLGGEILVNATAIAADQAYVSVAMNASGAFVVTWSNFNTNWDVRAQIFDNTGAKVGGGIAVNTTTAIDQKFSSVAMDNTGNFVVTWQSFDQENGPGANTWGIYARRFDSTGAALTAEIFVNGNALRAGDQISPSIAMNASNGNFVVVWSGDGTSAGDPSGIVGQQFTTTGIKTGGVFLVNTTTSGAQVTPSVAMNTSGRFVVAWNDPANAGDINARVYNYTAGAVPVAQTAVFAANSTTAGSQVAPSAAISAAGNVVITWTADAQDGSGNGVYARHFNPAGVAFESEFRINTTTTNNQQYSSVALNGHNYVVSWSGEGVGDTSGVFVQRVTTALVVDTANDPTGLGDTSSIDTLLANKGSDGLISLREAIIAANNTPNGASGANRIYFNIAGAGVQTITPTTALPTITRQVTIDGATQPSYAGTPLIRIDGALAGAGADGISLANLSDGSTIRGLMLTRFGHDGVVIQAGADNITVAGNWIGTNGSGLTTMGNVNDGIEIFGTNAIIGGTGANDRNVINNSGNEGINISGVGATGNVILGNYIGLEPDGISGSGNADVGIAILPGATGNIIGGTTAAARNVISNTSRVSRSTRRTTLFRATTSAPMRPVR
jgi:hypothetical protein